MSIKKKIAIFVVGLLITSPGFGCSVFQSSWSGNTVVAKNFDWADHRGFLIRNPAGIERTGFGRPDQTWVSKYSSLSFTTLGPGFPVSGMNERGLVVESLVNYDASARQTGNRLISLEWVQFVLDQFGSVDDVLKSIQHSKPTQVLIGLHFFICDKNKKCAVVEPDGKEVRIYKNLKHKALANSSYSQDLQPALEYADSAWTRTFTLSYNSHARMGTLLRAGQRSPESVSDLFSALEEAKLDTINKWQLVWNQTDLTVHYRIKSNERVGPVMVSKLKRASCTDMPQVTPLTTHNAKWTTWGRRYHEDVANRLQESVGARGVGVHRGFATSIADHTFTARCKKTARKFSRNPVE